MANVFDPNWLQRMFTPEGYGYQWQNRPDQGGGEFTGEIPGVYEGDAQDLRMVPMPTQAPRTERDFSGGQPGEMTTWSPPVVNAPASIEGGEPDLPIGWPPGGIAQAALVRPRVSPVKTWPGVRRFFPTGGTATGAGSVPSSGTEPVTRPRMTGAGLEAELDKATRARPTAPVSEPMDRARSRWSRWSRWGSPEPSASPVILESRAGTRLPTATGRAAPSIAEPFVPATKYGPSGYGGGPSTKPFVGPPRPPITEAPFVGPPRPPSGGATPVVEPKPGSSVPGGLGGTSEKFGWRTNIPEYVKNLGHTKTAALLRSLGPAAWGLTGYDLYTAGYGGLGSGRTGILNQAYGGDELVEVNAQRAMQGLPPIAGEGAGEGGIQDPTEYFTDARNYGNDNWVNPASYWWGKMPWNNRSPATNTGRRGPRTRRGR